VQIHAREGGAWYKDITIEDCEPRCRATSAGGRLKRISVDGPRTRSWTLAAEDCQSWQLVAWPGSDC
jgi:hypothetical protein